MLGYRINPSDVELIEKVNFVKTEFTETVCNIYINVSMTYGIDEYFLVGRIYKDYKCQGNYTYIDGVEKEYKTVRPVLNALIKKYNTCDKMDKILIFAGVKKDITETRAYKKLIKEAEKKVIETVAPENNNIEVVEPEDSHNSEPITTLTIEENKIKPHENIISNHNKNDFISQKQLQSNSNIYNKNSTITEPPHRLMTG